MATRSTLTTRELEAALADHGVVTVREQVDELVDVRGPADLADEVHLRALEEVHAVTDVLGDGPVQHLGILGHIGDAPPQ